MKPAQFDYYAPLSIAEAIGLRAEHGDRALLLAGGQTLVPLLARRLVRPKGVIDLNRVPELSFVTRTASGLRVGALTRLRHLERDPQARAHAPWLATAAALGGPVQVRNRATLGGALAYGDPAAEYPAVALALDARIELRAERIRHVPAEEFFIDAHRTALRDTEVLTAVEFPQSTGLAVAIERVAPRSTDRALAGAVAVTDGITARLVLFGVGPTPLRSATGEAALASGRGADEVADAAVAGLDPPPASGLRSETRRALARGAVLRAVNALRNGASHA